MDTIIKKIFGKKKEKSKKEIANIDCEGCKRQQYFIVRYHKLFEDYREMYIKMQEMEKEDKVL